MSSNFFSDIGVIFFVSWSFVLGKLSIAAFGDLLPWRTKNGLKRQQRRVGYSKNR